jgi:putative redox protein
MPTVTARTLDGYKTEIKTRSHTFYADEPEDAGGTDTAPTPMEMMAGALASCMAITTRLYADRKKWPLEGVDVHVDIERMKAADYAGYQGDAQFVHEYRVRLVFRGPLDADQRERLLDIAGKCPVHRAVETPAFFVTELVDSL